MLPAAPWGGCASFLRANRPPGRRDCLPGVQETPLLPTTWNGESMDSELGPELMPPLWQGDMVEMAPCSPAHSVTSLETPRGGSRRADTGENAPWILGAPRDQEPGPQGGLSPRSQSCDRWLSRRCSLRILLHPRLQEASPDQSELANTLKPICCLSRDGGLPPWGSSQLPCWRRRGRRLQGSGGWGCDRNPGEWEGG